MSLKPFLKVDQAWAAKVAAVKELRELDHAFLPKRIVRELTEPFGFVCKTYTEKSDPRGTPKGLTLPHGVRSMNGRDAAEVAAEICCHLKVDYEFYSGCGKQLRVCCDALLAHLGCVEQLDLFLPTTSEQRTTIL